MSAQCQTCLLNTKWNDRAVQWYFDIRQWRRPCLFKPYSYWSNNDIKSLNQRNSFQSGDNKFHHQQKWNWSKHYLLVRSSRTNKEFCLWILPQCSKINKHLNCETPEILLCNTHNQYKVLSQSPVLIHENSHPRTTTYSLNTILYHTV